MTTDTVITVQAICDGEPGALAALCARRGAPVLAYCEHVAAPRQAGAAAAHAFERLRRDMIAAGNTAFSAVDLDAALLTSTRRAAAELGVHVMAAAAANGNDQADALHCPGLEPKLVAQIERPLGQQDRAQLDEHLATCPACSRAMERLQSGQRAFDRPPRAPLPPKIAEQLLGALIAAAPVTALNGDADAVRRQAWQQLGHGPGATNGAAARHPAASTHAAPAAPAAAVSAPDAATAVPPFAYLPIDDDEADEDAFATSSARSPQRRAARPESGSLGALVSDSFEIARHRVLGPRPGSVERVRKPPRHMARLRRLGAGGPAHLRPADRKKVELAAIGLFVTVAATATLVTFMMASPSSDSPSVSRAVDPPAATAPNPAASEQPARDTPASEPPDRSSDSGPAAPPEPRAASEPKPKPKPRRTERSTPSRSTGSARQPARQTPPPAAVRRPQPPPQSSGGGALPGGDFSTEGDT